MSFSNKSNESNLSNANSEFYEEMLLRYAANKYVKTENLQLEKELQELEEVSDVEVNLEKIYKKERRNDISNIKKRMRIYKMGSAVAVFFISLVVITATIPPVRAAVFDFFINIYNTHTDISNYSENEVITDINHEIENDKYSVSLEKEFKINYLPEGFFATLESKDSAGVTRDYYDEQNNSIMYNQLVYEAAISIDTENAEINNVDINGANAVMTIKSEENTINITWKQGKYFINLTSMGVSKEELLKVARSIK